MDFNHRDGRTTKPDNQTEESLCFTLNVFSFIIINWRATCTVHIMCNLCIIQIFPQLEEHTEVSRDEAGERARDKHCIK